MKEKSHVRRKMLNWAVRIFSSLAALIGIIILAWILYEVVKNGARSFNWAFFTKLPAPPGIEGGGVANAIFGTLVMTILGTLLGVPIGIMAGVYLSEFGGQARFSNFIRFATNVLMGIPSIIIGLFVYTIMVVPFGHFSGYAGAVGLALIMLPVVTRTTEDMLNLVPNSLRESALALGVPRWKATFDIIFRAAKTGLITGILLAVARVSGETAPLLFTSLNSPYWPKSLSEPTANLTITIFNYAMSPYEAWQKTAWGASLLIMAGVLLLTIVARSIVNMKEVKR